VRVFPTPVADAALLAVGKLDEDVQKRMKHIEQLREELDQVR